MDSMPVMALSSVCAARVAPVASRAARASPRARAPPSPPDAWCSARAAPPRVSRPARAAGFRASPPARGRAEAGEIEGKKGEENEEEGSAPPAAGHPRRRADHRHPEDPPAAHQARHAGAFDLGRDVGGAAASGHYTWTPENLGKALLCMFMSGPLLTGYTQTINDWEDREIDAINEPNRPIPSGAISEFDVQVQIYGSALRRLGRRLDARPVVRARVPGRHRAHAVRVVDLLHLPAPR